MRLEEKQAAAAAGQILLAGAWAESLAGQSLATAQILVTLDDTENRRRYLNARATMETLLRLGAVPVVNENDTVATTEIRYGDNDRLSARVAVMAGAETLVLLSDVDGLYTADPGQDPAARHIAEVADDHARDRGHGRRQRQSGRHGRHGEQAGRGQDRDPERLHGGLDQRRTANGRSAPCSPARVARSFGHPAPRAAPRSTGSPPALKPLGTLAVDEGAIRALRRGSSLLPAGVLAVEGAFERGDAVLVQTREAVAVAKGLVAYDAADARKIKGHQTDAIEALLGYRGRDEMIHRDDLVLL